MMNSERLNGCTNEPRKSGNIVESPYSADRFSAGVLLGALVGWLASAGVDYLKLHLSFGKGFDSRLAIEVVVSACLLLPRPLLMKTVLRSRRNLFMRDADVNAMLKGRVMGIAGGIWLGATVNSVLF